MRVLIATDGSSAALHAAERAHALVGEADLTLLSVITSIPGSDAGGIEGSVYTPDERNQRWEAEWSAAADDLARTAAVTGGAPVEQRIEVGEAGSVICGVAEEVGADVVVVGSHGRGFLSRVLLGSVSEYVVRHAPCPVLVVRTPAGV